MLLVPGRTDVLNRRFMPGQGRNEVRMPPAGRSPEGGYVMGLVVRMRVAGVAAIAATVAVAISADQRRVAGSPG
jgi:hypothetical protein